MSNKAIPNVAVLFGPVPLRARLTNGCSTSWRSSYSHTEGCLTRLGFVDDLFGLVKGIAADAIFGRAVSPDNANSLWPLGRPLPITTLRSFTARSGNSSSKRRSSHQNR